MEGARPETPQVDDSPFSDALGWAGVQTCCCANSVTESSVRNKALTTSCVVVFSSDELDNEHLILSNQLCFCPVPNANGHTLSAI